MADHRARCEALLGMALAGALMALPGRAAVPATYLADMQQTQDVFLEVEVNGEGIPFIVHFRASGAKLSATGAELARIGIAIDKLGIAGSDQVALDALAGVRYRYDKTHQRVAITLPDDVRKPFVVDSRQLPQAMPATSGRGVVLNYDAVAQNETGNRYALWLEQRYFDPDGVFSNTGIAYLDAASRRYLRYDTSWSRSDPATLRTVQWGDAITSSLAWSRSIRFAGFQWRSNFALRPDLVTFPLPVLTGSAVVPSSLDLYVNNMQHFNVQVPSGPFVVNEVPGITGGGNATLITRNALGQTVTLAMPIYIDTQMLATGLSSYSLEAGFLRRDYGAASFHYDPHLAGSGSWRRGISDALTVEAHGEATDHLFNAGTGALVRLGTDGVLNGAIGFSAGRWAGTQLSLGYQWIEPHYAIDAQSIRTFGHYGDLASRDGAPVPTHTDRLTVSLPFFGNQNFALSYIGTKLPQVEASRIASLSYGLSLRHALSLNLSAYRDIDRHRSRGVFLNVSLGLENNVSLNAVAGSQGGRAYNNLQALRPADYAGGWGWGLQTGQFNQLGFHQAQLQYLGSAGQLTGLVQNYAGHTTASFDALGSIVLMDGDIQFSRRIYDGFALVSTNGVAGVPVLHENRLLGRTDDHGHLLVPDLNAYQDNHISIDPSRLPVDMRIDATAMVVVPQVQSGVLGRFSITRYAAASVLLHDASGKPIAAGTRVHHVESGADTIVGYDGLTFINDLQATNHLQLDGPAWHCTVTFSYTPPTNHALPSIGPFICRREAMQP
ncbi:fimbria/pilus outer membrane usher protein [Dyella choica]|uniref:Fimbrial biogenesis outer membrane usher protein n=1 Tax=Dyella choica TaxID=1927959 RepID=A0A432M8I1_9GAMM|nr:fimbria/pilus outer membrane usher protein [Dyella choica]RUL77556.1 fimbrial biogenesis outer membrane usher protein [Dyella choica]